MQGAQLVLNQRRLSLTRGVVLEKVLDPGFFSIVGRSYNRGPGFESPKSIRNDESEGSGGQNFPLRDLPLALRACARAHLRWWHHECRPLPTGASEPTESGVLQVHREGARRRLLPHEQEGR